MATAAEIQAKITKLSTNLDRFDGIVNGPSEGAGSEVTTDDGPLRTIAKLTADIVESFDGPLVEAQAAATEAGTQRGLAETAAAQAAGSASDAAVASGVSVLSYASRTSLGDATVGAAIKTIETRGFATEGDDGFGRHARASFASLGAYSPLAYRRSTDRIMPDGSTDAVNGGYFLRKADVQGDRVEGFGTLSDNSTPAQAGFLAAKQTAVARGTSRIYGAGGTGYSLTAALDLTNLRFVDVQPGFKLDAGVVAAAPGLKVGGFNNGLICDLRLGQGVVDGTSTLITPPPAYPCFQIAGLKNSELRLDSSNYVQFRGNANAGAEFSAVAYMRTFTNGHISLFELTDDGNALSWVNGNTFNFSRVDRYHIIQNGPYPHNHNIVHGGQFEGSNTSIKISGYSNFMRELRFEQVGASPGVEWLPGAWHNGITFSYDGSTVGQEVFAVSIPITDRGAGGNWVASTTMVEWDSFPVISISPETVMVGSETETCGTTSRVAPEGFGVFAGTKAVLTPGRLGVTFAANVLIAATPLIAGYAGEAFTFDGTYTGNLLRPYVVIYDLATGALITSEDYNTTAAVALAAGGTQLKLTSRGAVRPTHTLTVVLDDASVHAATVSQVRGEGVVVLSAPIPAGRSVLVGAAIVVQVPWVGFINQAAFNTTHGAYTTSADLSAATMKRSPVVLLRPCGVRLGVYSGVGGTIRDFEALYFTSPQGNGRARAGLVTQDQVLSLAGAPFQGILQQGRPVFDRTSKGWWYQTYTFQTQVDGALAPGATTVTLDSWGAGGNNDVLLIHDTLGRPFWARLSGKSGNTGTLRAADGTTAKPIPAGYTIADNSIATLIRWTPTVLLASATYDPPSLLPGQSSPIQTIAVANGATFGALAGDFVDASFSNPLQGVDLVAWVSATSVVSYYFSRPDALLSGSATYDPPSIAAGASVTTTLTVTGAALGDLVTVSFDASLAGLALSGYVSAANTVTGVFSNPTAGVVDLASGTLRALVRSTAALDLASGTVRVRVIKQ